ncbi:MAG: KUP/HAK/KT family potassium transporter [Bacteroidota bacterium]|nr:KUP/HAK/KT family potassium transporter [Candidatus Kapabacteria bacterium]MCS7302816.1 KUP/HAK/KT family potassium transporter [Candidatus Kapabacteria bacterium]MCX7936946.1 KUP/HAK/KT family potassium transporter [Chlorobiota bacterium]MDW8075586.1 KUP/HAK/KT family potassium transporter [Bacteroidota bacterium]MDW8272089.1 KUP/HAK/KT family potassium transporter [Bacteroidota bacterium]
MPSNSSAHHQQVSATGALVAMGIVFGDIGTSPLYTISAIVGERTIDPLLAYGALSAVFWTLTFLTTLKYVVITLRADNRGEGGILALYALVRRRARWLVFPAIIGAASLFADGLITPSISVSSAIEGLRILSPHIPTVPLVVGILVALFAVQQFGTDKVGKAFGPIMLAWFVFIAGMGALSLARHPEILAALDPRYAVWLITEHPEGFWILGGVFLCTTGAEALYSDLGHCGRGNIRLSWAVVKVCLLLSYAGQCAWLLDHVGSTLPARPFYAIVPTPLIPLAIAIATLATIIASQALISGSYTLVNEAMQLGLWFRTKVKYPTLIRGQLYIPRVNWALMVGCITVVLYFGDSTHMEAAYGLAITLTMLMTSILVTQYLLQQRVALPLVVLIVLVFAAIELSFLGSNLAKLFEGGWFTMAVAGTMATVMYVVFRSKEIRSNLTEMVPLDVFVPVLEQLSRDESIPKFATHLVYLTASSDPRQVEQIAIDSIIRRSPKRANIYWFVNVNTVDEPYRMTYNVEILDRLRRSGPSDIDVVFVRFNLGFRIEPRLNIMFRHVVEDMVRRKEIDIASRYRSLERLNQTGDFRFVIFQRFLSYDNELPPRERLILNAYYFLSQRLAASAEEYYGLDTSNVVVEKVPLVVMPPRRLPLVREEQSLLSSLEYPVELSAQEHRQ